MVFAIVCVSDRCSQGVCQDKSGPLIKELVSPLGKTAEYILVPDEKEKKRLIDALLRRGFSWGDVRRVFGRVLDTYFEDCEDY